MESLEALRQDQAVSCYVCLNVCSWLTNLFGVCPQWYENQLTFPLPGFQESPRIVRNSCSVRPGGSLLTLALMPSCAAAFDLVDLDDSAGPCV